MPADHPAQHAPTQLVDVDLRAVFGLTTAERRVVGQLLQGHSVKRMAVELGISGHTVRTHLKRALTKANAHSQVELVVRIFVLERRQQRLS